MLAATTLFRATILAAAVAAVMLPGAVQSEDDALAKPDPEGREADRQGAGIGVGGSGTVTGPSPAAAPQSPIAAPQPNLRHATPRYEATFAVSPKESALVTVLDTSLPGKGLPEFAESPLRDVAAEIAKTVGVPVQVDTRALEDAGMDLDTPFSSDPLENISLGAALNAILDGCGLTVTIQDESLIFTTKEKSDEHLIVGVYPLPTQVDHRNLQTLIDLIQSTIAAETWDTVGGQGAIRIAEGANALVISQPLDAHLKLIAFMRTAFDTDLVPEPGSAPDQVPTRVYRLHDKAIAKDITANLAAWCNAALGKAGDPDANVMLFADDRIIIQSTSRPFHVYAAEMIRALDSAGVHDKTVFITGGGTACWVAREVYGAKNPRWLLFRAWLLHESPAWLRGAYLAHGEAFASWLHNRPVAKAALRPLMDAAIPFR